MYLYISSKEIKNCHVHDGGAVQPGGGFLFFITARKGGWKEGQEVFSYCALDDFTALLTAVWMKDATEAENHSLRTKFAQTKVQGRT